MSGRLFVCACCLLMLVGCDSSQPKVVTADPSPSTTTPSDQPNPHASPSGSPHGMPPMGAPHGMPPGMGSPGMGDPHGMSPMGMGAQVAPDAPELGMTVEAGSLRLVAPEGWMRKRPLSGFTMAQFGLPLVEGDTGEAKLTISIVGGSVDDNIKRWQGQYSSGADGKEPEVIEIAGRRAVIVDCPNPSGDSLLGAIISTDNPAQNCYVKLTGPTKTLDANADKFRGFVKSFATADEAPTDTHTPHETSADIPAETPAVETPNVEAPAVEAPAVETPAVEAPNAEAPAVEAPAVETPTDTAEDSP